MYLRLRRGLTSVACIATLLLAAPAHADGGKFVTCEEDPNQPYCLLKPSTPGNDDSSGGNSGGADSDGCVLERVEIQEPPPEGAMEPGAWYRRVCTEPDGTQLIYEAAWVTDTETTASLAQQALSRLNLPKLVIRWNPPPPADQILHVQTWLWVEAGSWAEQSATASVPGLSVTATATPTRVVFATGDGAVVGCDGPGTAWQSGMDPLAASPTCGYTYPRPGSYILTATMSWTVVWAGGGASGTLGPLSTSVSQPVRVVEAGAVNTSGR